MPGEKSSPGRIAWLRFRRNFTAMAGLSVILISVILAVFCYLFSPDNTKDANDQHLELALKRPGFSINMLKVPEKTESKNSFPAYLVSGKEPEFRYYPFTDCRFDKDSVILTEYTGENESVRFYRKFSLWEILYPVSPDKKEGSGGKNTGIFQGNKSGNHNLLQVQRETVRSKNICVKKYYLGTDRFGRDMLSRMMIGTRISLSVGFISVLISLLIGLSSGAAAGYFRGKTDLVIQWVINVVWSVPTLLLVIAITFAIGRGFWQVFIAVGLTMWVEVARIVRGQVLSLREREFIEAARALGFRSSRIIIRHIIPNVMGPVIVISAANFASAILMEASLSFLGIGVQPPAPSWGSMIKDHYGYIIVGKAYLAVIPGIAIMLLVLAFTLVGNGLRDAYDVKDR